MLQMSILFHTYTAPPLLEAFFHSSISFHSGSNGITFHH